MATQVKSIPEGYHTLTPCLTVNDGLKALDYYTKAFNAKVIYKMDGPDGKLMHAELQIGDSRLMVGSECKDKGCLAPTSLKGTACSLYVYVNDVDASFKQAISAGGKSIQAVEDGFWGDRYGTIEDPFGHRWMLATHQLDLTKEQIREKAEELFGALSKS